MADKEIKKNDDGVDLLKCCKTLWRHKIIIIGLTVIFAALMFARTAFLTDYTYTSYGILHMANREREEGSSGSILKSDLDASEALNATYIEILQTRAFLKDVSDQIGGKYSYEQISRMLSITAIDDTSLLKVSVKAKDPSDAQLIAQTILDKAPTKLTSVFKGGEVAIVDPAQKPAAPNSKGYAKNMIFGALLGLILGAVYAFVREFMDKKVHGGDDVAKRYGISLLGQTAQIVDTPAKHRICKKADAAFDESRLILTADTDFDTVETYKSIRTNIMFSTPKQDLGKVIAITSSAPGEGKTTTAINLAITFAQTGARILLIDCDLRRARVHRYMQLECKEGVSNVVCGYSKLDDVIRKNVRDNFDCITAGENPPNPSEILQTNEFGEMIAELQKRYDYIFIDTPPITVVTDAAIVIKHCLGVVVVIRNEMTRYDLLDSTVSELSATGGKILGTIVHGAASRIKKNYGYYDSVKKSGRYSYRYSDEQTAESDL